jgi:hypothetical protein
MEQILFERLTGLQLVKKMLEFYGSWRIITSFKRALHLLLS